MSKIGLNLIDIMRLLSKHHEANVHTWPAMPLVLDQYDGAAAKAVLAAHKALGGECTTGELLDTMATAFWWVQTLAMMAEGEAFKAELERLAREDDAAQATAESGGGEGV